MSNVRYASVTVKVRSTGAVKVTVAVRATSTIHDVYFRTVTPTDPVHKTITRAAAQQGITLTGTTRVLIEYRPEKRAVFRGFAPDQGRSETELMARHRLFKKAVLPDAARNAILGRNYQRLQREIGSNPYARALGDESVSIINEVATLTARTFDPGQYRNPQTGGHFTAADTGDPELDRLFRNYLNRAVNTALGREVQKRRREIATDFHGDDALPLYSREVCPSFMAEVREMGHPIPA